MYVTCMYMSLQCIYQYLWVKSVKSMFWQIKWITSGTHDAPAQVWLPIHTSKGTQGTINNMRLQDMIQLSGGPTRTRLGPLISFVGKSQLILQVLTNPLSQLGWQPTQDRMCSPVYVLQPRHSLSGTVTIRQGQRGGWILNKLDSTRLEKIDVKPHTTCRVFRVGLHRTPSESDKQIQTCIYYVCTLNRHVHTKYIHVQGIILP